MAETVNIHHAKTHFSKLIERVGRGEEIVVAKAGKPVAKLVPAPAGLSIEEKRRRLNEYIEWQRKRGPRLQPGDDIKAWINEGRP